MLHKTDAILRVLEQAQELPVAELAKQVGEPVSSTYRLLASLTALRVVEPGLHRGHYRLGVDLLRIGGAVEDGLDVRELAVPELRALLSATDATSFLCVRADERAVCVERFEGRGVRSLALSLGNHCRFIVGRRPERSWPSSHPVSAARSSPGSSGPPMRQRSRTS